MITIEDIRNPASASGFRYVVKLKPNASSNLVYWRACRGKKKQPGDTWWGTSRRTPEEAAQDYCDYINGNPSAAPSTFRATVSIDMGNTRRHAPKPEKVTVVRKKYRGPHDLYDVLIYSADGSLVCRKVGITARGHGRYSDICKTFGLSIKPNAQAITFPSERAAKLAEDAKVAQVARDSQWRQVGAEAFVPVKRKDNE